MAGIPSLVKSLLAVAGMTNPHSMWHLPPTEAGAEAGLVAQGAGHPQDLVAVLHQVKDGGSSPTLVRKGRMAGEIPSPIIPQVLVIWLCSAKHAAALPH